MKSKPPQLFTSYLCYNSEPGNVFETGLKDVKLMVRGSARSVRSGQVQKVPHQEILLDHPSNYTERCHSVSQRFCTLFQKRSMQFIFLQTSRNTFKRHCTRFALKRPTNDCAIGKIVNTFSFRNHIYTFIFLCFDCVELLTSWPEYLYAPENISGTRKVGWELVEYILKPGKAPLFQVPHMKTFSTRVRFTSTHTWWFAIYFRTGNWKRNEEKRLETGGVMGVDRVGYVAFVK